jgi:hypothetical protein
MSSGGNGGGGFGLPGYHFIHEWMEKLHQENGLKIPFWQIATPFGVALLIFLVFAPAQTVRNFGIVVFLSPLWLTLLLAKNAWHRWVESRQFMFNTAQDHVLLEIRLPRETLKSPLSMEAILANMHITPGQGTWYKRYWLGRTRPWYSLELVSLGGRVHLYVFTRAPFRHIIETYFYAQYPGVEVVEATDYTRLIDPTKPPYQMFVCEYQKNKPSPYPIKTYVDYGMDKQPAPEPEEVTDPMSQVIEFLGSLNPNEQLWIHIMIRYTKGEKHGSQGVYKDGKRYTWREQAREEIQKIKESTVKKTIYTDPVTHEKRESDGFPNPSKGDAETMAAIERNVAKPGWDVGIRSVYIAKEGHYRDFIGAFVTQIFRPYTSEQLNYLGPAPLFSEELNDFPWEDPSGKRREHLMEEGLEFARRRAYFHYPYVGPYMQMSSEEIASLFHVPSSTVAAPNLPRIQSTTTDAPHNLPV